MARPAVLLDLDGTLTDPYPGITGSIAYAFETLGRPRPEEAALRAMIGPPLEAAFRAMLDGDPILAREALRLYRERYAPIGLYENLVFPGIPEAVAALKAAGLTLTTASSKPRPYVETILAHFGLIDFFDAVHGSEFDGTRVDKAEVIAHVLAEEGIDPAAAVMIGDRMHDVAGARANGLPVIGVAWGYGSEAEFAAEPPDAMIAAVAELPPTVFRLLGLEVAA